MNDEQIKFIREIIKARIKENLSELENDIIDTADEILKDPLDYNRANNRMAINYAKYEIVTWIQHTQPYAQRKAQLTPHELRENLRVQFIFLCNKFIKQNN